MKLPVDPRELDGRLTMALETAPSIRIPVDFAARIATQLPPLATSVTPAITPSHYGRHAAIVSMAVLLVLIFSFAHRAAGSSILWITAQWIFCAQFAVLAVWIVARRISPSSSWPL